MATLEVLQVGHRGVRAVHSVFARGRLFGDVDGGHGCRPARTLVFKVQGDRFNGIVCRTCDDPAAVFRIEDGRFLDTERVTFVIRLSTISTHRRRRVAPG